MQPLPIHWHILGHVHRILLYDIVPEIAIGKAMDIAQSTMYSPRGTLVEAAIKPEDITDCDVVVITAGVPRKKEMTRADLLHINAGIVKEVTLNIKKYSPNAHIVCVSNPLDVMTYVVHKVTGWERNRIVGMGGALDASRMAYQIRKRNRLWVPHRSSRLFWEIMESIWFPTRRSPMSVVFPSQIFCQKGEIESIIEKTKNGGAEIVKYLGTSAFFAPGRAISVVVEAILSDEEKVIPSSVMLKGEYGHHDVTVGVPAVIGANCVEKVIEYELDDESKAKFAKSVEAIKANIAILENDGFFDD